MLTGSAKLLAIFGGGDRRTVALEASERGLVGFEARRRWLRDACVRAESRAVHGVAPFKLPLASLETPKRCSS